MAPKHPFGEALELAELLKPAWATISDGIRESGVPTCEGEPDPTPALDPEPKPADIGRAAELENEVNRLRRELAKRDKDARDADDERKKEEGRWKEVAEENERKANEATEKLTAYERQQRVTEAAAKLNFRDPADAHRFLDGETMDDPRLVTSALERLSKDKQYLIAEPAPAGPGLKKVLKDGESVTPSDADDIEPGLPRLEAAYAESSST